MHINKNDSGNSLLSPITIINEIPSNNNSSTNIFKLMFTGKSDFRKLQSESHDFGSSAQLETYIDELYTLATKRAKEIIGIEKYSLGIDGWHISGVNFKNGLILCYIILLLL